MLIWRLIYNPDMGLLNQSLQSLGLAGLTANWLGDPALALGAIIGMGIPWIGAFGLLIYLAGLMGISADMYDAYTVIVPPSKSIVFLAMASPDPVPSGVRPENQPVAKIFVMSMRSHSEPSSNSTQLGRRPHSRYPTFS